METKAIPTLDAGPMTAATSEGSAWYRNDYGNLSCNKCGSGELLLGDKERAWCLPCARTKSRVCLMFVAQCHRDGGLSVTGSRVIIEIPIGHGETHGHVIPRLLEELKKVDLPLSSITRLLITDKFIPPELLDPAVS